MGLPIFQISLKICREISTAHSNNPNPRDLGVGDQKNAATENSPLACVLIRLFYSIRCGLYRCGQ